VIITDDILKKNLPGKVYVNGRGSHYICFCPYCEKEDHLYVQRKTNRNNDRGENVSYMWECKRCGENGWIKKLFAKLKKLLLITLGSDTNIDDSLKKKIVKFGPKDVDIVLECPTKTPPLGFKRIQSDPYLDSRGFVKKQYEQYVVGRTKLLTKLKDYVIMLVIENGECKGYVARSERSKEWIDAQNEKYSDKGLRRKYLRYQNSVNTDFGKLLMGIDEVVSATQTVIIVEGPFDKTKVDGLMELWMDPGIKCVCSFGSKLSDFQIQKLQSKGVESVVLLFDPDAIEKSKKYAFELTKKFQNVRVGFSSKVDPGDLSLDELYVILSALESPLKFSLNKVQKKLRYGQQ